MEDCHDVNEIMEYLKICLSLSSLHYPERIIGDFRKSGKIHANTHKMHREIPETAVISNISMA